MSTWGFVYDCRAQDCLGFNRRVKPQSRTQNVLQPGLGVFCGFRGNESVMTFSCKIFVEVDAMIEEPRITRIGTDVSFRHQKLA